MRDVCVFGGLYSDILVWILVWTPAGRQQASHHRLLAFLRGLPKACFAPQTFEIMRTLLSDSCGPAADVAAAAALQQRQDADGGLEGGGGVASNVNSWLSLGDSSTYLQHLPVGYTIGM